MIGDKDALAERPADQCGQRRETGPRLVAVDNTRPAQGSKKPGTDGVIGPAAKLPPGSLDLDVEPVDTPGSWRAPECDQSGGRLLSHGDCELQRIALPAAAHRLVAEPGWRQMQDS